MVAQIIQLDEGKDARQLVADEGKLLFLAYELEELGIEAEVGALRHSHTHSYGDRGILILFFDVQLWKGEPKSQHHTELKWIDPKDLGQMEIPEANRKILSKLMELLK